MMNERITNIEIQLMHHENTIQQLNDVITHLQIDIEKLQKDFKLMMAYLQSTAPSDTRAPQDEEPPPHY